MRRPTFIGVYSENSTKDISIFDGGSLYFVWMLEQGNYGIQKIDKSFLAVGKPLVISAAQLKNRFTSQPGIFAAPVVTPDFHIAETARPPASRKENVPSDLEEARKAKQVENDLRNDFNKALRALSRPRDRKGALAALEKLAAATKDIVPEHRHMFRDFGVSLRKKSQPELALACARRVLELSPDDDHAHFNIARILGILGEYNEAEDHLREAMRLDKTEKVYGLLREFLREEQAAAVQRGKIDYND